MLGNKLGNNFFVKTVTLKTKRRIIGARKSFTLFMCAFLLLQIPSLFAVTKKDSRGRLRIQSANGESMYAVRSGNSVTSLLRSDETEFTRRMFDSSMRVVREKTWALNGKSAEIMRDKVFMYGNESGHYTKTEEKCYDTLCMKRSTYTNEGLVLAQTVFDMDKNGNVAKKASASFMWRYDEKSRVVLTQSAKKGEPLIKKEFVYTALPSPNETRYENNILVYKKTYTAQNNYEESVFFEDGTAVITSFVNSIRTAERVEKNGTLIRSRSF